MKKYPLKKTPEDWAKEYKVLIYDPDGWDRTDHDDFQKPITRKVFKEKMGKSTVIGLIGSKKRSKKR